MLCAPFCCDTTLLATWPIVHPLLYALDCVQVITALLSHLTRGLPSLTVAAGGKVSGEYWGKGGQADAMRHGKKVTVSFPKSLEGELTVVDGEMLTGTADKAIYGKYGLVHAVQVCHQIS